MRNLLRWFNKPKWMKVLESNLSHRDRSLDLNMWRANNQYTCGSEYLMRIGGEPVFGTVCGYKKKDSDIYFLISHKKRIFARKFLNISPS